jgi:hypothetical protein
MLLQRQIVVKALDKQTEDLICSKYAITPLHSIACIIILVIFTINQTVPIQRYQSSNSHCIMMTTTKLRSTSNTSTRCYTILSLEK